VTEKVKEQYDQFGRQYYDKRKDPIGGFWNSQIESPAMSRILDPLVKEKNILDAGCGAGAFTARIAERAQSCVGIDISTTMISIARENHPNVKFQVASLADLPFDDQTFDLVYSSLVLHYFQDLKTPLKEIYRVLKPQGSFVLSIHHPFTEVIIANDEAGVPFKVGKYFHQDKYEWGMAGMLLESYHHTFQNISLAARETGFMIRSIDEPRPAPESASINPKAYLETRNFPKFCIFELACVKNIF